MVQTVVVALLLLADAILVVFNIPLTQSPLTVAAFGWRATTSLFDLLAAVAGGFVLLWLAGAVDRGVQERRVRERNTTLQAMGEELQRIKAVAYDRERPPLADLRARLEAIEQDLKFVRTRVAGEDDPNGRRQS